MSKSSNLLPTEGSVPLRELKLLVEFCEKDRNGITGWAPTAKSHTAVSEIFYAESNEPYTQRALRVLNDRDVCEQANAIFKDLLVQEFGASNVGHDSYYDDFVVSGDHSQEVKNLLNRATLHVDEKGIVSILKESPVLAKARANIHRQHEIGA